MTETTITFVHGRRVWDSRGRPTVEADVLLDGGAVGRATVPAGASTGTGEALDLRDGGEAFGGYDVRRAVANVNNEIAHAVHGAIGITEELALGLFTRRLHEWRSVGGSETGCAKLLGDALFAQRGASSQVILDFARTQLAFNA